MIEATEAASRDGKKGVVRNLTKFIGYSLCQSLFFNKVKGLRSAVKKNTLAQVFSFGFCEISKNTFFKGHLRTTASVTKNWHDPFKKFCFQVAETW